MVAAAGTAAMPMPVSTIEQIAQSLRQAGDAGRRITVIGAMRNVGTTYAAISLARALANEANVVLVDLAFGAPNLSVISTDPERARHRRSGPRLGFIWRHHHPRSVFQRASGRDRQYRK